MNPSLNILTVVTYGMASSPYNAVRALLQCARDNCMEFPLAAGVVENDAAMSMGSKSGGRSFYWSDAQWSG